MSFRICWKGLYLCLDYNHNPIARRIVLVKQSDCTDVHKFLEMEGGAGAEIGAHSGTGGVLQLYLSGRAIISEEHCTVLCKKLDETDLERKKMLKI